MFGQRLVEARRRAGLTQTELAVALGERYNAPMISMVENNHRTLLFEGAVKAAQELNVSLDYLAGLTDDERPAAHLASELADARARVSELEVPGRRFQQGPALAVPGRTGPRRRFELYDSSEQHPASRVAKPRPSYGLRHVTRPYVQNLLAAAGDGRPVFDESDELEIGIAPSALAPWARPDAIIFIRAAGDSMLPKIKDGDLLAVDPSSVEPIAGQVFVLCTDTGTVVKRLQRIQHRWHLVSDNETYEPRPVTEDDRIVGQVAWVGPPSATGR